MAKKSKTASKAGTSKKKRSSKKKAGKARRTAISSSRRSEPGALKERLRAVREIGAALATAVGLDAVLDRIVPNVSKLMRAERTTLFFFDGEKNEIWSKVIEGRNMREIRLAVGQGISGWVAENRKAVNVSNAYDDPRFDPSVDARSGFRTSSVAATPLLNRKGDLLGVLQVLNSVDGTFSPNDLELLDAIGAQTAYAVENAHLSQQILDQNRELEAARQKAERRRAELDLLYQIEQETSSSIDLDTLLDSVIVRVCERLRSEAGSVLLREGDAGRLFFRGVAGSAKEELKQVSLESGEGIVGWVATTGEPAVVNRPDDDPRHDRGLAAKIDYPAQALLAVPLIWDRKIIGAVEVLNPRERPGGAVGYDLEDLKVLTLIAGQVARAVSLTRARKAHMDTDRLAAIGRMLAGVAHDLRNPMTAVSGYAQLMADEENAQTRAERCERMMTQIDEMTAMIGDLLAFARGDSRLTPALLPVDRLADDVREAMQLHCSPRGIGLEVESQGGTVFIDVGRTKRILFNLAKNAVDVLGEGDHLGISLTEKNEGLEVCVVDNGPGIPESIRSNLFQPFVTAGKSDGTGLGLSIVKRFVDDQGGQIEVESRVGEGTSFSVRLPKLEINKIARVTS